MSSADYNLAFQNNHILTYRNLHYVFEHGRVGYLHLPSGKLVGRDPHLSDAELLFAQPFPAGSYPVFVTRAFQDIADDIAFAGIQFTNTIPVRWEPTLERNNEGYVPGYAVDSATGSFMDYTTSQLLDQRLEEEYTHLLPGETPPTSQIIYESLAQKCWAEVFLNPEHQTNLFVFNLNGDGGYPSYYGYDADGAVACIVTDFFGLESRDLTPWPSTYPPVPASFDAGFFSWLGEMERFLRYRGTWETMGPISQETLLFIEALSQQPLPEDFRLYYAYCAPKMPATQAIQQWWPPLYTKMQSYLKTEKTLLPLDAETVAMLGADGTYAIYEWYNSDSNIPVFTYQCNLRTYLLTKEMLDL